MVRDTSPPLLRCQIRAVRRKERDEQVSAWASQGRQGSGGGPRDQKAAKAQFISLSLTQSNEPQLRLLSSRKDVDLFSKARLLCVASSFYLDYIRYFRQLRTAAF